MKVDSDVPMLISFIVIVLFFSIPFMYSLLPPQTNLTFVSLKILNNNTITFKYKNTTHYVIYVYNFTATKLIAVSHGLFGNSYLIYSETLLYIKKQKLITNDNNTFFFVFTFATIQVDVCITPFKNTITVTKPLSDFDEFIITNYYFSTSTSPI